ncbi:type IV secretion protein Rhs [Nostoc minutum NIES-26]|uniref:Type IV secretion protein Rhs n=1 Tax=Nostoc minutum NIES-26 TaxID=1844469 RepID=A0A367Q1D3_9NOSO|nr:type IV secretion protein Rhs [Nostoc minutum NIES-26]
MANYCASPIIRFKDRPAPPELMADIIQICVEESLSRSGMFTIVIKNDYQPGREQDNVWRYKDLCQIGTTIVIGFTSSTTESQDFNEENSNQIFKGEITAIETCFNSKSQAPIVIRGYDISHQLCRGKYNRSFQNMTDSDIVKKIAEEVNIPIGTIEDSGIVHEYVFQPNQTNMEFLHYRAVRIGFELFVKEGKLYFCKPKPNSEKLTLKWLKDLTSFRVIVDSREQVNQIKVQSWDFKTKKTRVASRSDKSPINTTIKYGSGRAAVNQFEGKKLQHTLIYSTPTETNTEIEAIVKALDEEREGQFVEAYGKCEGNTKIRPGHIVKLDGMGQYSGEYYITDTRHIFCDGTYSTEFSVRGSRGLKALVSSIPHMQLQPGQTFLVGIVTDNEDPENMGRVKVKFPTLTEEHTSNWARVVAPGGGAGRGIYWMPEINDEVLVCFEHGDIHRPYIIGGVWNGKDPTPRSIGDTVADGNVRLRVSQTRYGHKEWFVDEDKGSEKRGYYIQTGTGSGHRFSYNDTEQYIEIETIGQHKIRLDDKGKFVEIKTSGGQSLRLDDNNGSASINSSGNLSINAQGNIDIKANGTISISGAIIKLN